MTILACVLVAVFLVAFFLSPFPYWRTFFVILSAVLTRNCESVGLVSRLKQLLFLLQYLLLAPLWTALWYFDELFFGDRPIASLRTLIYRRRGLSGGSGSPMGAGTTDDQRLRSK